jgi:hypothetical protein
MSQTKENEAPISEDLFTTQELLETHEEKPAESLDLDFGTEEIAAADSEALERDEITENIESEATDDGLEEADEVVEDAEEEFTEEATDQTEGMDEGKMTVDFCVEAGKIWHRRK